MTTEQYAETYGLSLAEAAKAQAEESAYSAYLAACTNHDTKTCACTGQGDYCPIGLIESGETEGVPVEWLDF